MYGKTIAQIHGVLTAALFCSNRNYVIACSNKNNFKRTIDFIKWYLDAAGSHVENNGPIYKKDNNFFKISTGSTIMVKLTESE